MKNTIEYFLRTSEDYSMSQLPSILIIGVIILTLALNYIFLKSKHKNSILRLLAVVCLTVQFLIFSWYTQFYKFLSEGLPLYHCRIIMFLVSVSVLFKVVNQSWLKFTYILAEFGLIGSMLALAIPDVGDFKFPHLLYFTYFIGHSAMFTLCSLYVDENKELKIRLKEIVFTFFLVHFLIHLTNSILLANYSYLSSLPYPFDKDFILNRYSFLFMTSFVIVVTFLLDKIRYFFSINFN